MKQRRNALSVNLRGDYLIALRIDRTEIHSHSTNGVSTKPIQTKPFLAAILTPQYQKLQVKLDRHN